MARQYTGENTVGAILRLLKNLLDGKQDALDEISAEETQEIWDNLSNKYSITIESRNADGELTIPKVDNWGIKKVLVLHETDPTNVTPDDEQLVNAIYEANISSKTSYVFNTDVAGTYRVIEVDYPAEGGTEWQGVYNITIDDNNPNAVITHITPNNGLTGDGLTKLSWTI